MADAMEHREREAAAKAVYEAVRAELAENPNGPAATDPAHMARAWQNRSNVTQSFWFSVAGRIAAAAVGARLPKDD